MNLASLFKRKQLTSVDIATADLERARQTLLDMQFKAEHYASQVELYKNVVKRLDLYVSKATTDEK